MVIPALNAAGTIGDTLAAVLSQVGAPAPVETIVVDNGSSDATVEVAGRFPIRCLHEARRGPSAARNRGLEEARAPIIAYLDADTLPSRRWLAELVRPLADPAVMLTAGRILSFRPQTLAERYVDASGLYDPRHSADAGVFRFAVSMNMAVRRDAACAIGGWAADLDRGEDVDFSHRLLRLYPDSLEYCGGAVLFHRNRRTARALAAQAHGYGRGVAMIYRRYPDTVRWDLGKTARALRTIAGRSLSAGALGGAALVGLAQRDRAGLAACHALWACSFWCGFFTESMRRKAPPP